MVHYRALEGVGKGGSQASESLAPLSAGEDHGFLGIFGEGTRTRLPAGSSRIELYGITLGPDGESYGPTIGLSMAHEPVPLTLFTSA
jgi:hypothetical protein